MKKVKLLSILLGLFLLSACSLNVKNNSTSGKDYGGVFVSADKGDTWRQMPYIPTISGTPGNISSIDINTMVMDPSDSKAVYLAMIEGGLYYTYNISNGWNKITSLPGDATVKDISIASKNKCVLFVAIDNKLHKSIDCGRTFTQVYFDNNTGVSVTAIAVDHYDNNIVYLGTSRGDVLRSLDGGNSWKAIQRLKDSIAKVIINPNDSRSVFVVTNKAGVHKFNTSGGATLEELEQYNNTFDDTNWTNYNDSLKEFNLGLNFKDLIYSSSDNSLLLATDKVVLRSYDDGKTWTKLSLLTPEKDSSINDLAINPKNSQEIYYVTNTSFFRSSDGGSTWTVKSLPTIRAGVSLLIDFNNTDNIYLGVKKIEEE